MSLGRGGGSRRSGGLDDGRASSLSGRLLVIILRRSVDGNLDCNLPATDLLAAERLDGFLLRILVANVDEAVALAAPGRSPAATHNASRGDGDASIREESSEAGIVDVETEVGNEEHGLGGLANGVFASWTGGAGLLWLAGLFGLSCLTLSGGGGTSLSAVGDGFGGPGLALKDRIYQHKIN
jgi:hypothetical protein